MVTPIQYIDTIVITRNGGSVQDNDGNWIETQSETLEFKCRFIPNGSGKSVSLIDGTNYIFAYRIAFPIGTNGILPQDKFTYVQTGEEGVIKRFKKGQLHSVAWV